LSLLGSKISVQGFKVQGIFFEVSEIKVSGFQKSKSNQGFRVMRYCRNKDLVVSRNQEYWVEKIKGF
jgi:hypothetical protein